MFDKEAIARIEKKVREWKADEETGKERKERFATEAGIPIKPVYTPLDVAAMEYLEDMGLPGEYPYTRGIHSRMYRAALWHMRQITGYGLPEHANARNKYLMSHGGQFGFYGGPSMAIVLDMPTHYGLDSDDPRARGEVGRVGVAIDHIEDLLTIMDGIPMEKTFININCHALGSVMAALYIAAAQEAGIPIDKISGSTTNDPFQNHVAEKIYVLPLRPYLRIALDGIEYAIKHLPRWSPIAICGEQYRDGGANAIQELCFTIANGTAYLEALMERGLSPDEVGPKLSFRLCAGIHLFEEAAKLRAGRRVWAKIVKSKGAQDPRSCRWRFSLVSAGLDFTAQEPYNNIVRATIQALAAVMAGCQALSIRALDEALAIPSESAHTIALRTGQIIAEESGVADTVDPLGGSFYVESLTNEIEERVWQHLKQVEAMGEGRAATEYQGKILRGVLEGCESGYFEMEAARSMQETMRRIETGEKAVIGLNKYATQEEPSQVEIMKVDPDAERIKIERLREFRAKRDKGAVQKALAEVRRVAGSQENMMPCFIEAFKARATWGEVAGTLKEVHGEYQRPPVRFWGPSPVSGAVGRPTGKPIRAIVANIGLNGHEAGALVVCKALADAGIEVIYTGLNQIPEQVVAAAVQEDADIIGLSSMVDTHQTFVPRLMELMKEKGCQRIPVILGGIVNRDDIPKMKALGVKEVFPPGTTTREIIETVAGLTNGR